MTLIYFHICGWFPQFKVCNFCYKFTFPSTILWYKSCCIKKQSSLMKPIYLFGHVMRIWLCGWILYKFKCKIPTIFCVAFGGCGFTVIWIIIRKINRAYTFEKSIKIDPFFLLQDINIDFCFQFVVIKWMYSYITISFKTINYNWIHYNCIEIWKMPYCAICDLF